MRPIRALVFEDEEIVRRLIAKLLARRGYDVKAFRNPTAGPLACRDGCPCPAGQRCADIIVTDLAMPFMDGLTFIRGLVGDGCRAVHTCLLSGFLTERDVTEATRLGVHVLAKPFDVTALDTWLDTCESSIDRSKPLSDWE